MRKINYSTGEEIFKVKIEDSSGAFIENWVFLKNDLEEWVRIIKNKYGLKPREEKKADKDLDWLS